MKARGWRVALTVATLGLALVAGLVALNWATVRDHAEAWWFQARQETETIDPQSLVTHRKVNGHLPAKLVFRLLAGHTQCPVVYQPRDTAPNVGLVPLRLEFDSEKSTTLLLIAARESGYRIVEQRFPRRAYVVVGYPEQEPTYYLDGKPKRRPRSPPPQVKVEARHVERP